jgi:hypothetical protein
LLAGLLFGVEPLDPTTFTATSVALLIVAAVAATSPRGAACVWLPSTRSEQTSTLIGRFEAAAQVDASVIRQIVWLLFLTAGRLMCFGVELACWS